MSAALIARNPAHQPVRILAAKSLPMSHFSRLLAGRFVVRSASRPEGVVGGPGAGSLHPGPHGAFSGRPRGEMNGTSMCKSLQAWVAFRATIFLAIPVVASKDAKTLFINAVLVNERVADGPGLAHRLQGISLCEQRCYFSIYPQSGVVSGSATQAKRRQAPRARGCTPSLRVDRAGAVAFPRARCWRLNTRTGFAGVKVVSVLSCASCVRF
jgi:hypothetical protein